MSNQLPTKDEFAEVLLITLNNANYSTGKQLQDVYNKALEKIAADAKYIQDLEGRLMRYDAEFSHKPPLVMVHYKTFYFRADSPAQLDEWLDRMYTSENLQLVTAFDSYYVFTAARHA